MAPSNALRRARLAYERAHIVAAGKGLAIAIGVSLLAVGLHPMHHLTWAIAGLLAASLAILAWRGGSWRRGAFAGVLAGLPPLIVPSIVYTLSHGQHCAQCTDGATLPCIVACFGTSSLVGILVGYRAMLDASPARFAAAAAISATFTGLIGCGTTGFGGALGIVVGLVAGGLTGWIVAGRTAHVS
jgi:hypothetical protein